MSSLRNIFRPMTVRGGSATPVWWTSKESLSDEERCWARKGIHGPLSERKSSEPLLSTSPKGRARAIRAVECPLLVRHLVSSPLMKLSAVLLFLIEIVSIE